jgi:hypothetical protein
MRLPLSVSPVEARTASKRSVVRIASALIIGSFPLLAWRRADPAAASGHIPFQYARRLLRGSHLPLLMKRPVPTLIRPCVIRVDAAAHRLVSQCVRCRSGDSLDSHTSEQSFAFPSPLDHREVGPTPWHAGRPWFDRLSLPHGDHHRCFCSTRWGVLTAFILLNVFSHLLGDMSCEMSSHYFSSHNGRGVFAVRTFLHPLDDAPRRNTERLLFLLS